MKKINLLTFAIIGCAYAKDNYFKDIRRAELFVKTDLKMPNLTINLNEEDYNNFFLNYKCRHDTNTRYLIRNEDCYNAPWVDLNKALNLSFDKSLISKDKISNNDLEIINGGNITLSDFEHIFTTYTNFTLEEILSSGYGLFTIPDYETEEAGLTLDINGDISKAEKIKFAVGGKYTKAFEKLGFNIKIKKGVFLERKNLRLRTEAVDPSFLREKLAYDLCNIIGLPTLSLNYARVFFNDKYMGLYALRDAFKSQWIEYTFGEKNTKHLYTCDREYKTKETEDLYNCINDDENIKDDPDWKHFIDRLKSVKNKADLEEFFDVETYIKWQVIKYLFGSWDHETSAHNQVVYMYHDTSNEKDKWIPMLYDFDSDFGAYRVPKPRRSFSQETKEASSPFYKLLQLNDENEVLISYIDEFMRKAFNPKDLIPRIDQLKEFLSPYIKEDRTPDENGRLPGRQERVNIKIEDYFTFDDFNDNSEFTTIRLNKYTSDTTYGTDNIMGLKQWIIERFQFACEFYKLDCSYADEYLKNVTYEVDIRTYEEKNGGCRNSGYSCCVLTKKVELTDNVGQWGVENGEWCLFEEDIVNDKCWALAEGYPCCKNKDAKVYSTDKHGKKWGIEDNNWCGIIEEESEDKERQCPKNDEYKCCGNCDVYYVDDFEWGVEDGKWCLTPFKCKATTTTTTTTTKIPITEPSIFTIPDETITDVIEPTDTIIGPSIITIPDDITSSEIAEPTNTIIEPSIFTIPDDITSSEIVEPTNTIIEPSIFTISDDTTSTEIVEPTNIIIEPSIFTISDDITSSEIAEPTNTIIEPSIFTIPDDTTSIEIVEPTITSECISTVTSESSSTTSVISDNTDSEIESDISNDSDSEIESDISNDSDSEIESDISNDSDSEIESDISDNTDSEIESDISDDRNDENDIEIVKTDSEIESEIEYDTSDISNEESETEEVVEISKTVTTDINSNEEITENPSNIEDSSPKVTITTTITSTLVNLPMPNSIDSEVVTDAETSEEDQEIVVDNTSSEEEEYQKLVDDEVNSEEEGNQPKLAKLVDGTDSEENNQPKLVDDIDSEEENNRPKLVDDNVNLEDEPSKNTTRRITIISTTTLLKSTTTIAFETKANTNIELEEEESCDEIEISTTDIETETFVEAEVLDSDSEEDLIIENFFDQSEEE